MAHHGGIFCNGFTHDWSRSQVYTLQHGRGTRGFKSRMNGDWVSGPIELTEEELGANRRNFYEDCLARKLDTDEYWQSRMPDWSKVKVPLFSAANWGGQGLHPRGNFEGFVRAASEAQMARSATASSTGRISTPTTASACRRSSSAISSRARTPAGTSSRRCCCRCATSDKFVERHENEWPLARTQWTKFYLDPADYSLSAKRRRSKASGDLSRASATA